MSINDSWQGMPEFIQEKKKAFKVCRIYIKSDSSYLILRFDNISDFNNCGFGDHYDGKDFYFKDRNEVSVKLNQTITDKSKSIWFPFKSHWGDTPKRYKSKCNIGLRYPVYIVSKGRSKNGITSKALNRMGIPHYIVVEMDEEAKYKEHTNAEILVLPSHYLDNYETCDDLGNSKSKGPGAARNFCIDHSTDNGFKRHWVMDDNFEEFYYLNKNEKLAVDCDSILASAEDFVDRFSNVPVAGMNYAGLCKKTDAVPPIVLNTRIYSCLLIENGSGYRWRGRYNEDTDLSLRVLKDGLCTIQFNAFLCGKVSTQRMKGGNSKEFYESEGTLPKSQMLADMHPDVAKVVWRFNRWHHHVNYKPFKHNSLVFDNYDYLGINNYGMYQY